MTVAVEEMTASAAERVRVECRTASGEWALLATTSREAASRFLRRAECPQRFRVRPVQSPPRAA